MVRKILRSVLQQQQFNNNGLNTVLCEVEAIVIDQPITKLPDDPKDLESFTPNHILLIREYLPLLHKRQKDNQKRKNLKPGYIVILMGSSVPRDSWPLRRVRETIHDKNGL